MGKDENNFALIARWKFWQAEFKAAPDNSAVLVSKMVF